MTQRRWVMADSADAIAIVHQRRFPRRVRGSGRSPRTAPHQEAAVLQTGISPKNRCVRSDDVVVLRRRHDVPALARSSTSQLTWSQYVAALERRRHPVDRKMRFTSARGFDDGRTLRLRAWQAQLPDSRDNRRDNRFSTTHCWPYTYRVGEVAERLKAAVC
jgi:hypothetical protein